MKKELCDISLWILLNRIERFNFSKRFVAFSNNQRHKVKELFNFVKDLWAFVRSSRAITFTLFDLTVLPTILSFYRFFFYSRQAMKSSSTLFYFPIQKFISQVSHWANQNIAEKKLQLKSDKMTVPHPSYPTVNKYFLINKKIKWTRTIPCEEEKKNSFLIWFRRGY